MVDDLDPGQEGLVELRESGDLGALEFGQEVRLDELEEALNLASAFGVVGCAQDALDAEGSADGIEVLGSVDLAANDVDRERAAIAQDSVFEAILHTG